MHRQYKNMGKDAESLRKNRVEQVVMLRKEKRDDVMAKKRNIMPEEEPLQEEHGVIETNSPETFVLRAQSADPEVQFQAIVDIRKLLSSGRIPPMDSLIAAGILPILVRCLESSKEKLQLEAAWALTNIASGTSDQTLAVVGAGAVPLFINLLNSPSHEVSEQALWALGNIIGDGPELRDYCLELGVLTSIFQLVSPVTPVEFLQNVSWVLVNVCRSRKNPLSKSVVLTVLPVLSTLIHCQDMKVVVDAIWAISYLTDGGDANIQLVIDSGVVPFIVSFLASPLQRVLMAALRSIGNIVTGTDDQTQFVIDCGALQHIPALLSHINPKVNKEVVWFVSNIAAGTKHQIEALYQARIFPMIVDLLRSGDYPTRQEAAWAVANTALGGAQKHIQHLIELDVITPLCALLSVQSSQAVQLVLDCLLNILNKCSPHVEDVCRMIEECNGLEHIEKLQHHGNEEIYRMAYHIIDNFFSTEEEGNLADAQPDAIFQADQQNVPSEGFSFQ